MDIFLLYVLPVAKHGDILTQNMAEKPPSSLKKDKQVPLEEYLKIKEKNAKSKLQLHFPPLVLLIIAVPIGYFAFLIIYFLVYLRFVAEH